VRVDELNSGKGRKNPKAFLVIRNECGKILRPRAESVAHAATELEASWTGAGEVYPERTNIPCCNHGFYVEGVDVAEHDGKELTRRRGPLLSQVP
jgi:hypothetical protein